LAEQFELVPVCPEQEAGLGVPRPPVQLVGLDDGVHALGVEDQTLDVTQALRGFAAERCESYGCLSGFILKARSPSCGLGTTPLFNRDGSQTVTSGLFAAALQARWPNLPIVDEEHLQTAEQQQAFIERVNEYARNRIYT